MTTSKWKQKDKSRETGVWILLEESQSTFVRVHKTVALSADIRVMQDTVIHLACIPILQLLSVSTDALYTPRDQACPFPTPLLCPLV
jgi:hypothetical protein